MDKTSETKSHETRDQLIKLTLGTVAGFLAGKLVENAYDTLVEKRRNANNESN